MKTIFISTANVLKWLFNIPDTEDARLICEQNTLSIQPLPKRDGTDYGVGITNYTPKNKVTLDVRMKDCAKVKNINDGYVVCSIEDNVLTIKDSGFSLIRIEGKNEKVSREKSHGR